MEPKLHPEILLVSKTLQNPEAADQNSITPYAPDRCDPDDNCAPNNNCGPNECSPRYD